MSLYKRGNVYWTYVWVDGIRHQKSTETGNRRLAEDVERNFKDELRVARFLPAQPKPEMKFGELAALFLANGNPRPYHVERLKLLLPHFSEVPIGRINRNAVQEYRQARHREKERLSDTTINRDIECLRRILFWAVDEGTLLTNPLSRVPMVRERRKRRAVMSVAEEQNLLAAASGHLREIITAALDTGMRRGEILAQRWEDVELTRKLLFVSHSKTPEGEAREIPLTSRSF